MLKMGLNEVGFILKGPEIGFILKARYRMGLLVKGLK